MSKELTVGRIEFGPTIKLARDLVTHMDAMDANSRLGKLAPEQWPRDERLARALVASESENEALRQIVREALPVVLRVFRMDPAEVPGPELRLLLERMRAAIGEEKA